jgi:hypothetical protein
MNFKTIASAAALFASTAAFAVTTAAHIPQGVEVSTDPAKAAEVERHAQELQAQQKTSLNTSGTGSKKATSKHHKKMKKQAANTSS